MNESLVQWVLMHEPEYLQSVLGFGSLKKVGSEITTDYGRVDFIYETFKNEVLVIELETGINSVSKYRHCIDQILRYKNLEYKFKGKKVRVILLYAQESTSAKFNELITLDSRRYFFLTRLYSLMTIKDSFQSIMDRLNRTSGLTLSRSVALGVSSLSWLNKFMLPFLEKDTDKLQWNGLKEWFNSQTSFYVLKRLAEDFELVSKSRFKRVNYISLTEYGKRFRDAILKSEFFDKIIFDKDHKLQSTNFSSDYILELINMEQKRILVEILLNGNLTKLKTNVFHFLRFIYFTEGEWMPKMSTKITSWQKMYINNILNSSYSARTLKELMQQLCNYCVELELVERIVNKECQYDKLLLTSLGSRVIGYFDLFLHLKRERIQIPLQVG
jgi:hypothetical protein